LPRQTSLSALQDIGAGLLGGKTPKVNTGRYWK